MNSMQIILAVRDNGAVTSYRASRYLRSAINETRLDDQKCILMAVNVADLSASPAKGLENG